MTKESVGKSGLGESFWGDRLGRHVGELPSKETSGRKTTVQRSVWVIRGSMLVPGKAVRKDGFWDGGAMSPLWDTIGL